LWPSPRHAPAPQTSWSSGQGPTGCPPSATFHSRTALSAPVVAIVAPLGKGPRLSTAPVWPESTRGAAGTSHTRSTPSSPTDTQGAGAAGKPRRVPRLCEHADATRELQQYVTGFMLMLFVQLRIAGTRRRYRLTGCQDRCHPSLLLLLYTAVHVLALLSRHSK
jgi:hypothetical protein